MPDVQFATDAGSVEGYLALPEAECGTATLVLHQAWGLDEQTRSVCDRLAKAGFFALAPSLCRGEIDDLGAREGALSSELLTGHLRGAVEFLRTVTGVKRQGVGAVGFGYGGGLALSAARALPAIATLVLYYPIVARGTAACPAITCPVLGHFGTADSFISLRDAKALEMKLRDAGAAVTFEKYTGAGHAFFDEGDRLDSYDERAAQRSWTRTVAFLGATLNAPETG
jgi:carboxymethylenebutenolidase